MNTDTIISTVRQALDAAGRSEAMLEQGILSRRHNPDPAGAPLEFVDMTTNKKLFGATREDEVLYVTYKHAMPHFRIVHFRTEEAMNLATTFTRALGLINNTTSDLTIASEVSHSCRPFMKVYELEPMQVADHMPLELWKERQYEPLTEDREHVCAIVAHVLKTVPLAAEAIAEAMLYLKEHPQESIDLALATGAAEWDK